MKITAAVLMRDGITENFAEAAPLEVREVDLAPPGRGEDEDFQPGASPRKHRLVEHKGAAAAALQLAAGGKSRGAKAALSAKASLRGRASLKGGRGGQQPRPPGTPAHLPGDTDILPQPPAAAAIAVGHSHCLLVSTAGLPFACGGGLYGRLWGDAVSGAQLPRLTLSLTWRTE